jgi:putative addiction module component (TIGR02574 family)
LLASDLDVVRLSLTLYPSRMATVLEIKKLALNLPERERANLAANLLESLPAILSEEDGGLAEALRRDSEIEADPAQAIALEQLDSQVHGRRR